MTKLKDFFYYVTDERGLFNPIHILQYALCVGVAGVIFHLVM